MELKPTAAEAFFQECAQLLDSARNGIAVITAEGIVTVCNRAARNLFNDGRRPVAGSAASAACPPISSRRWNHRNEPRPGRLANERRRTKHV